MYTKIKSSWLKHFDFLILDMLGVAITFLFTVYLRIGTFSINLEMYKSYRMVFIFALVLHLCVSIMGRTYSGILRRGYFKELQKTVIHNFLIMALLIIYMFLMKTGDNFSRLIIIAFAGINTIVMYLINISLKHFVMKRDRSSKSKKKLLLICTEEYIEDMIDKIYNGNNYSYEIIGIAVDGHDEPTIKEVRGIPVIGTNYDAYDYACENVVDCVLINSNRDKDGLKHITNRLLQMGIVVHININSIVEDTKNVSINKINGAMVISNSINQVGLQDIVLKRIMDIAAGIVGCLVMGILFIFVAPAIKIADPKGPIFFKQKRVGRGGREFYMYKFRSMYSDAEERKAELMEENKMDGNMFKMDADPRIIGSGKDGTKKGLGHFIRATSIDEFPNFISILTGDMSLVGTRPPTMDEYQQYEHHHKSRLAIKPGLTGLWQISGRSDITDFEEIVELDNKYIRNWSFVMDIRIVLKTVIVVFTHKGSV